MYVVLLPNGDRAEAHTLAAVALAARCLIREAADRGASSRWLRQGLIVTREGRYDGLATTWTQGA